MVADLLHPYQNSITQGVMASGFPVSQGLCLLSRSVLPTARCCTRREAITKSGHDKALTGGKSRLDARTVAGICVCKIPEVFFRIVFLTFLRKATGSAIHL
jgi:hypothetical protein